MKTVRKWYWEY